MMVTSGYRYLIGLKFFLENANIRLINWVILKTVASYDELIHVVWVREIDFIFSLQPTLTNF